MAFPKQIETMLGKQANREDGGQYQRNLFDLNFEDDLNGLENKVATYLDQQWSGIGRIPTEPGRGPVGGCLRVAIREPRLPWEMLIQLYGDEATLRECVEAFVPAGESEEEVVDLACKYLSGWRPERIGTRAS